MRRLPARTTGTGYAETSGASAVDCLRGEPCRTRNTLTELTKSVPNWVSVSFVRVEELGIAEVERKDVGLSVDTSCLDVVALEDAITFLGIIDLILLACELALPFPSTSELRAILHQAIRLCPLAQSSRLS